VNARILRRFFLPAGIAALIGASLYATTGTSSAASTPQSSKAGAGIIRGAGIVRYTASVVTRGGKAVPVKTGVATVVEITPGGVKEVMPGVKEVTPGGVTPAAVGVSGPAEICMAFVDASPAPTSPGNGFSESISFGNAPFVLGSTFEGTTNNTAFSPASLMWNSSTKTATITAINLNGISEAQKGFYGVLYEPIGGVC
jgi:hypothetical protein